MNFHCLKIVSPAHDFPLLAFNRRNKTYFFAIRTKIDGKDCFFVSQTYPASADSAFRYGYKKFCLLNGEVTFWAYLFDV